MKRLQPLDETPVLPAPAGTAARTSLPREARSRAASIPLISPAPPRLSQHLGELQRLEESGIYSNFGPVNSSLERDLVDRLFGVGGCLTVCNATIGLMLAIREVIGEARPATRRYALMPSFTFAATAHAAVWCGLTPLLCDVDPHTWMPDPAAEDSLIAQYGDQIAVIVPYATFGNNLDLARYDRLARQHGIPVVVDAAASLGSLDEQGRAFGSGFPWPIVFSMHATKAFSVGEGGILYCADQDRLQRLRVMSSFGFTRERSATSLGLNAKLSEVTALTACLQLRDLEPLLRRRDQLAQYYLHKLGAHFTLQQQVGRRQVRSFQSVLLPEELGPWRTEAIDLLRLRGIEAGCYFSPHLAEQPFFAGMAQCGPLDVTASIASRVLSLPLTASMQRKEVREVADALLEVCDLLRSSLHTHLPDSPDLEYSKLRGQGRAA